MNTAPASTSGATPPGAAENSPSPETIRAALADSTLRPRDLAETLGVGEAALLAARIGETVTRIEADPDKLIPAFEAMGELMALTRNDSIVSEVEGVYENYRAGAHASGVFGPRIDLRIFRAHWVHAFAVVAETKAGQRLSVQVFDAAGDAVHKVYLPLGADPEKWTALRDSLRLPEQSDRIDQAARPEVEGPIVRPEVTEKLCADWDRMADTHKFNALMKKYRINRLGAYHMVGAPRARRLSPRAASDALHKMGETGTPGMIFVGNRGCIQIFSGQIGPIKTMGPWLNVLDPGFDMHLRGDHIAEVWAVTKPTERGPAVSVEMFDSRGALIAQIFGHRTRDVDHNGAWMALVDDLPDLETEAAE